MAPATNRDMKLPWDSPTPGCNLQDTCCLVGKLKWQYAACALQRFHTCSHYTLSTLHDVSIVVASEHDKKAAGVVLEEHWRTLTRWLSWKSTTSRSETCWPLAPKWLCQIGQVTCKTQCICQKLKEIHGKTRQAVFLAQYTDPWTSTLSNPKAPADSEIKKLEVKQHPVLGTIVPGRGHFKWQNTQTMDWTKMV